MRSSRQEEDRVFGPELLGVHLENELLERVELRRGVCFSMITESDEDTYWIRIRLHHPTMGVEQISREFSFTPVRKWSVGDRNAAFDEGSLKSVRAYSYWCYSTKLVTSSPDEAIKAGLAILTPSRAFLAGFVDTGGDIALDLSWGLTKVPGRVFSWETLAKVTDLEAKLGVDVLFNSGDLTRLLDEAKQG